ncbi:MAG: ABC transporter permease subunit [Anaerolineae bacterium]|nr:ABC transporter permease subunit [Anaerolineae bacterium]
MVAIPQDFEDAAFVDGASRWQVLWRIFIPLSWPGFLTVILLTALGAYHEFLFAITMIQKAELMPVATSLYYFSNRWIRSWGPTNSGAIIMSIPVIIIFLLLQRHFIEGLTQGGLK